MIVGKSITRVDAPDKVTGRAKFTEDLLKQGALVAKVLHSNVAHAIVRSIDVTEAEKVPGVLRVFTCFDVPDIPFATAGHPWAIEESHRDVADRHLLNRHVRYYGDDVAAVVAENEIACDRALRLIKVDYEVLPFVLDAQEAMKDGAPLVHEGFPNNVCGHSEIHLGNVAEAGTKHPLFSTLISNLRSATLTKRQVKSSSSAPRRSRRLPGASAPSPWVCPGARCGSSSLISAVALATNRMLFTSR